MTKKTKDIIAFSICFILMIISNIPSVSNLMFPANLLGCATFGFGTGIYGAKLLFNRY